MALVSSQQAAGAAEAGISAGVALGPVAGVIVGGATLVASVLTRSGGRTIADLDPARAALEIPARAAISQLGIDQKLLDAWIASRLALGIAVDRRPARLAGVKGGLVLGLILFASREQLSQIIQFAARGVPAPAPAPVPAIGTEEPVMAEVKIQKAPFNQGLGAEIVSSVRPAMIQTGVQPTIDIARYLQFPIVRGSGVQFFNGTQNEVAGFVAIIRIPAVDDEVIYIDSGDAMISPLVDTLYFLQGYQSDVGGLGIERLHWSIRKDTSVVNATPIQSKSFGKFIVDPGKEYVVQARIATIGEAARIDVGIQAYILPRGVWPLGTS